MQNRQNPLGGAYVSGLETRDELGAYAVEAAWRPIGSYTGTGAGRARSAASWTCSPDARAPRRARTGPSPARCARPRGPSAPPDRRHEQGAGARMGT